MERKQIKQVINGVVLFIFGVIEIILAIRLLLKLIGASSASSFVRFWDSLSNSVYGAFSGTLPDLGAGSFVLELNTLIAIFVYALTAILIIKSVGSLFEDRAHDKVKGLIDSMFKVIESILGLRLLFRLLGAGKSGIITFLYGLSSPFYEPFRGILPTIGQGKIVFETSTFIAIIIIVILDYASDRLLKEIFKDAGMLSSPQPQQPSSPPAAQGQPAPASPQQVPTVNVNYTPPVSQATPPQQVQPASPPSQPYPQQGDGGQTSASPAPETSVPPQQENVPDTTGQQNPYPPVEN